MTRNQQTDHNRQVIQVLINLVQRHKQYAPPAYRAVVAELNAQGLMTSRGNDWTPQRLFRMLQRNGYSGLWGLRESLSRL